MLPQFEVGTELYD